MSRGRAVKTGLKRVIRGGMRLWWPLMRSARGPTSRILTYHSIGYRTYEMNVTPENFRAQMIWLRDALPVIALDEAAAGKPGVAITFDDGYADNLANAVPVLRDLELPATIFVVSGHLGNALPDDPEPATGRLMNPDALRTARDAGIEIGAHTVNHPRLSLLDPAAQKEEIEGSKAQLASIIGAPVRAFAYPYGSALDYTRATMQIVKAAGFEFACSNRYGHNTPTPDRWALRRVWIDQSDTLKSFQDKALGRLDAMAIQDAPMGIAFRRALNRFLGTE